MRSVLVIVGGGEVMEHEDALIENSSMKVGMNVFIGRDLAMANMFT